jgi:hypothetical protein
MLWLGLIGLGFLCGVVTTVILLCLAAASRRSDQVPTPPLSSTRDREYGPPSIEPHEELERAN